MVSFKLTILCIFTKQKRYHFPVMRLQNRFSPFTIPRVNLIICLLFATVFNTFSQIGVRVTVESGNSTTTCSDIIGTPGGIWQVNIDNQYWEIYPSFLGLCYVDPPYMQYNQQYTCPDDIPATIEVCFKGYDEDGIPCNQVTEECVETICDDFVIPLPGESANYTLSLPNGLSSAGSVNFTIETDASILASNNNICDATDLGGFLSNNTYGDASMGIYSNICADNINEFQQPISFGWNNDQGVWFTFMTPAIPEFYVRITGQSDPENTGDFIGMQLAVFESSTGDCTGDLSLVRSAFNVADDDEVLELGCLDSDTRYFLLIDGGGNGGAYVEGIFGLEFELFDIDVPGDLACDADDLGPVPDGGMLQTSDLQTNWCATAAGDADAAAFDLQYTVWHQFQAPPSGNVTITATSNDAVDPVDGQLALFYTDDNTCSGNFLEVTSSWTGGNFDESITGNCLEAGANYWVLFDGSGIDFRGLFQLTIEDLGFSNMYDLQETICDGDTIVYGDGLFYLDGPVDDTVRLDDGCYSIVTGQLNLLPRPSFDQSFFICGGDSIVVANSVYYDTGIYEDIVMAANGCDSTITTDLVVWEELNATAIQDQMASSEMDTDGSASVMISGGDTDYTIAWNNGETTPVISDLPWGQYCVTVTDGNNCEDISCITVAYPGYVSIDVVNDTLACNGDVNGVLDFAITGGVAGYTYEWGIDYGPALGNGTVDTDGGTALLTDLVPGTYTISVTESEGFFFIQEVLVVEPEPLVTSIDTIVCFGESILINGQIYDATGTIDELAVSFAGCDSTIIGSLTVRDEVLTQFDEIICDGESIVVNGQTYNTTGLISEVATAFTGCDSTIIGMLTVLPHSFTNIDTTVCAGESVSAGNSVYTESGSYQDTLIAFNGCDSIISTTLLVQEALTLAVVVATEATDEGIADGVLSAQPVGGSENYTYLWSDGQTTEMAIGLTGGETYCVTVTDEIGCTIEGCLYMAFPLEILVDVVGDALNCNGDSDGSFSFSAYNGILPYNYTWYTDDNNFTGNGVINSENEMITASDLPAGLYTIYFENGLVEATYTVEVTEPEPLEIVQVSQTNASCYSFCDGIVNLEITGGTAPYSIDGNATTADLEFSNLCANTTFSVLVTDANDCAQTYEYSVTEPEEFIAQATEITPVSCYNGADGIAAVTTNGTPIAYLWSNGATTAEASNLSVGQYDVTVTNADNCEDIVSVVISQPDAPLAVAAIVEQEVSCNGETDAIVTTLSPTGGTGSVFDYAWDNGVENSVLENIGAGTYTLVVTDQNGCIAETVITVEEPEAVYYDISTEDINCFNQVEYGTVFVDTISGGVGPYVYSVDGENYIPNPILSDLEPGRHTLFIEDANGCQEETEFFITAPDPVVIDLPKSEEVVLGDSILIGAYINTPNAILTWTPTTAMSCDDCAQPWFRPTTTSVYTLSVLDTLTGCSNTATMTLQVLNERKIYIPNIFTPNNDGVNDLFTIQSDNAIEIIRRFTVYNRWGTVVFEARNFPPNSNIAWNGFYDGRLLNPGVYVYMIEVDFLDGLSENYSGDVTLLR